MCDNEGTLSGAAKTIPTDDDELTDIRNRWHLARLAGIDAEDAGNGWDAAKVNALSQSWQDVATLHDELQRLRRQGELGDCHGSWRREAERLKGANEAAHAANEAAHVEIDRLQREFVAVRPSRHDPSRQTQMPRWMAEHIGSANRAVVRAERVANEATEELALVRRAAVLQAESHDRLQSQASQAPLWVRHTHPWGFRAGQWAQVLGIRSMRMQGVDRPKYLVRFPDGFEDQWAVYDDLEPYEFSAVDPVKADRDGRELAAEAGQLLRGPIVPPTD